MTPILFDDFLADMNPCKCLTPPDVDNVASTDIDVCSNLATHDYIEGSKWSFALSFLALALVVPGINYLQIPCDTASMHRYVIIIIFCSRSCTYSYFTYLSQLCVV